MTEHLFESSMRGFNGSRKQLENLMASQLDPSVVSLFADAVRTVYQARRSLAALLLTFAAAEVTNEWGDGDNMAKRESLIEQTVSGFVTKRNAPDPSELEEFLDQYLQEMFNTEADDDSPYEVSHLICRLFELVRSGSIEEARALLSAPAASLDQCVADNQGEEDSSDGGSDFELTAEQQAVCMLLRT
ncbi:hypothetical protein GUITHDRAFT_107196 [Guillardia theta CCMP2712]|uniref:Uncharacterized protein n=1 Tax=Guillardia theta (strain CCMP2712) TaxID=905079 RepID=L1JFH5_GUITC|nr:hypothetical protein GUITHDRAFT_107196 [Guillardia theta CCMP2712]EKX46840.1 hypothetical protein GUITHDRAFT_107196 [Guillardia theta CCMP2712]|eukprot:XP_005833820.1 hypothetical protein GUITHDRAFT_107196 [Guillardia theta CCMP2712]